MTASAKATTARGAIVHTDSWLDYKGLSRAGYEHRPRSQRAEPGEHLLEVPTAPSPTSRLEAVIAGAGDSGEGRVVSRYGAPGG